MGPVKAKAGPFLLQAGQAKGDKQKPHDESRTEADQPDTKPGKTKSTKGTQYEHNGIEPSIDGADEVPADLAVVVQAWPDLPAPIKATIKALVDSSRKTEE